MTDPLPHLPRFDPQSQAEQEIALAMRLAYRVFQEIQTHYPSLPPTALSTGLINAGIRLGVEHAGIDTVASYLRGCADRIVPRH